MNINVSSFSEWALVFPPQCADQRVWEDQQMIWGPIGGTGGLIHKFLEASSGSNCTHRPLPLPPSTITPRTCFVTGSKSERDENFTTLVSFAEINLGRGGPRAINLLRSVRPRTRLPLSEPSSTSQWCLIRAWLAPWVETACKSIRCEVRVSRAQSACCCFASIMH